MGTDRLQRGVDRVCDLLHIARGSWPCLVQTGVPWSWLPRRQIPDRTGRLATLELWHLVETGTTVSSTLVFVARSHPRFAAFHARRTSGHSLQQPSTLEIHRTLACTTRIRTHPLCE